MEPNIFDQQILNWCTQNGWDYPQKENGVWYAIAPNAYIPKPVPLAEVFEPIAQEAASLYISSISAAATSFRQVADAISEINWTVSLSPVVAEGFHSVGRGIAELAELLKSPPCKMEMQSDSFPVEEKIKLRDKRNQKMMRSFLQNKFPTNCHHKIR